MDINIKVTVDLSDRTVALLQPRQLEDLPAAECNCTAAGVFGFISKRTEEKV